ncbi:MAG: hypothetical protein KVP17_000448 [Porospora cf. gigantea B]|uniref:uncharacterized protein n=1 Tax=Porospora cf. gigantea B TaxID=2853592 RepID=UPI003571D6F9|nr:MAG: hypothetical protein KVP17_000448 [Porospora cf. gigantea B]
MPITSIRPLVLTTTQEILRKKQVDLSRVHAVIIKVESELDLGVSEIVPQRLRKFHLVLSSPKEIKPRSLPKNLTHLSLGRAYKGSLKPRALPTHLKSLSFGFRFNQSLYLNVLPPNLESLTFGEEYNKPIECGVLPRSLKKLEFGYWYDQPIRTGVLPSGLQVLTLGEWYNQSLDGAALPSKLRILRLGLYYSHPLGKLRSGLSTVSFGHSQGSCNIPDCLPKGVRDLLQVRYSRCSRGGLPADPVNFRPFFSPDDRKQLQSSTRRHSRAGSKTVGFDFNYVEDITATPAPNRVPFYVSEDLRQRISVASLRLKLTHWGAGEEALSPRSMFASVSSVTAEDLLDSLSDANDYVNAIVAQPLRVERSKEDQLLQVRLAVVADSKRSDPVFSDELTSIILDGIDAGLAPSPSRRDRPRAKSSPPSPTSKFKIEISRCDENKTPQPSKTSRALPSVQSQAQSQAMSRRLIRTPTPAATSSLASQDSSPCLTTPSRRGCGLSPASSQESSGPAPQRHRRYALSPPPMTQEELREASRSARRDRSASSHRWAARTTSQAEPARTSVDSAEDATAMSWAESRSSRKRTLLTALRRRVQSSQ